MVKALLVLDHFFCFNLKIIRGLIMFINKLERAILTFFLLTASLYLSAQLEPVLEVNNERALLAQASQQKIDSFQEKTDKDSAEYKSVSKQIEGLKVYNAQKRKQIKRQVERMKEIEKTMKDSTVLQRQIPPLARRMFEGLKQFIALDIPFRAGERTERLSFIQSALDNPVVSPAEKLRQVLDGYAVESEYGRKIDTYKDTILIDDQERDVNILRIGRLVLAYQTSDLSETGIYNKESQSWEPLPGRYRNSIRDGIAMAKKVKTVDILELPVPAAEVAQ
jgi:hypothetical protein